MPAPANHRDDGLLAATLDAVGLLGPLPQRPTVHLDAGHDYQSCRQVLSERGMYGRGGGWFPATQARLQGHIRAGGVDKDVTFADADPDLNDQIDAAYRDKYRRYGERIVGSVVNPGAQAATIKLQPN